jgi:peptidyl-prolyl cis-trans isomerase SurA
MKSEKLACSSTPARENLFHRFAVKTGAMLLLLSVSCFFAPSMAQAAEPDQSATAPQTPFKAEQGIVAVVNDQIVSRYDLDQRVKLIMVTSGIPDTAENRSRIAPQVLRSLIDELLELQEAKRLEIKVSDKEINEQIAGIAQRANMTMPQIEQFLKQNHISRDSLVEQIRAEIGWNKVVSQQFRPLINVSEEEVTEILSRLKEESDQPRYLVSEILLTFDTPAQEQEMLAGAQRLAEQIRQGAPFAAVAQQFSRSPGAANGGDMGWVHLSQLPREVAPVVENMGIGAVSDPIRTLNGIYIIQLRSKQTGIGADPMKDEWTLARILLPLTVDAPETAVARRAREANEIQKNFTSCAELVKQIKGYLGGQMDEPRTVTFGSLDSRMKQVISKSKVGEIVPPIRSREGIEMVAICDHKANDPEMPTRDSIEDGLYSQQLSMMSRRHLRDLRRDAVIEMR